MSWSLSIGNYWSFGFTTTPRACISQENIHVALEKQEQTGHCKILKLDKTDSIVKSDSHKLKNHKLPPLVNALKASAEQNAASFHFPGHNRGQAAPSSLTHLIGLKPFQHDLPELPELDNLFCPEGPILEAQKRAAELFGASETWFLVGGSTCGVQTAIMATCLPGDTLVLPRNCHISAVSAMVLSGVVPKYVIPEYDPIWDIPGGITPSQASVEEAINELEMEGRKPAAILVISPSYHGICSDIAAISKLCHNNNIPLIVDEAHGAHFGFHRHLPSSALAQGADLVIQSTHKVLSSLTQSSMLHFSGNNSIIDRDRICSCLQTLQSSSPSYLLLSSLDAATAQLSDNRDTIFNKAIELAFEAKNLINKIPTISLLNLHTIDPLRVTIGVWRLGLYGFEADDIICRDFGVVSELVGTRSITLAFNLGTKREHVLRLVAGLKYLSETFSLTSDGSVSRAIDVTKLAVFNDVKIILSPREAFFARKRKVNIKESVGEVCGELICPYPPGIPVLFPGEVITEKALEYLLHVKSKGATVSGAADRMLSSLVVCDAS
ncbi:hypothetical protein BUALT_Bualt11G0075800 [Buddleja alternifolia]|uniref:Arginine decarboxylase n=1 Tax=Buddleja alternifolia TaxID=168488 RepID=A0AAV6X1C0_9LAMI|nr:hypothetical protein BUALT_Bualt11G0075800 [Buddleja alternifolia]